MVRCGELWHVTLHFVRGTTLLSHATTTNSCCFLFLFNFFPLWGSQNVDCSTLTNSSLALVLVRNIFRVLVIQYVSQLEKLQEEQDKTYHKKHKSSEQSFPQPSLCALWYHC